jgi:hypothetical protein
MRSTAICLIVLALLTHSLAAQAVRGVVVDSSGARVPFAIVTLADSSRAVLTDSRGLFQITDLSRGRYGVRVRQIGFRPVEREMETSDPLAAVRDTFRLDRLAVMLEMVSVGPTAACRKTGFAAANGGAATRLFDQLSLNTQRWMMIRAAAPDSIRYEQIRSYHGPDGTLLGEKTDTVSRASVRPEKYQPGAMLRQGSNGQLTLVIPAIDELGDARFLNTHCFRYVAQESLGARIAHRIDFEPADDITGVDVRGSVWLDTESSFLLQIEYHITGLDTPPRGVGAYKPVVKSTFVIGSDGAPRLATGTITQQLRKSRFQGKEAALSLTRDRLLDEF